MRLLVTRPLPEGERTAKRLRDLGHEACLMPVLRIVSTPSLPGPPDGTAIAVTSANALVALRDRADFQRLLTLPLFAVGHHTAEVARSMGFLQVHNAKGAARDLARLVAALPEGSHVFHPVGRDRAERLEDLLVDCPVRITTAIVYQAEAETDLAPWLSEMVKKGELDGVLHYSQRSALVLRMLCEQAGLWGDLAILPHFCLSQSIAETLTDNGVRHVFVAETPDEKALLTLVMSCPDPH